MWARMRTMASICDQQIRILYIPHILYVHIVWYRMLLVSWALWPCFTYSIWVFGGLPRSLSLVLFTVLGQSEIQLGASNGMTRIENGPILLSVLKMSRTRTHTRTHTHTHSHTLFIFPQILGKAVAVAVSCSVIDEGQQHGKHKLRRLAQSKLTTCMLLSYGCNCCCCSSSRFCCCCGCCNHRPSRGQASQRRLGLEVKLRDVLVLPLECNQRALAMMLLSGREVGRGGTHREETVADQ